jgi:predicted O-linked N-acetylglucosamine transferase (SPINDLY family)
MLPQNMHKVMMNASTNKEVPWPQRLEHNFTSDDIVLGAFNSLYKLDPRTWQLWMKIMQRCFPIAFT